MKAIELELADAAATARLGASLARALGPGGAVLYLIGELGTGKTTLVRALLQALGHNGPVRSPSYTLVEPYEIDRRSMFHLDLYRLASSAELEYLGLRDLDPAQDLILVEWPERGGDELPPADLTLRLRYQGSGRHISIWAPSTRGTTIFSGLQSSAPLI